MFDEVIEILHLNAMKWNEASLFVIFLRYFGRVFNKSMIIKKCFSQKIFQI